MRNNFWSQVPFLRLLPAVLAGILTAIYLGIISLLFAWLASLMSIVSLSFFIIFRKYFSSYRLRWVTGIHFYFLSFLFFYILTLENTASFDRQHFKNNISGAEEFIGQLTEEPIEKAKSRKSEIEIVAIKIKGRWANCSGKILAYLNRDSLSEKLSFGDMISFSTIPLPTEPPANPHQFNYKNFLRFHKIYHQVYLAKGKWNSLNANSGNVITRFAVNIRKRLLEIYRKNNIKGQEFAVLSALTLGYKDEIDAETQRAFSASGAMHVLAVSGLHVGIIFLALRKLLFFLEHGRRKKTIQLLIIAVMIWIFAVISGLSPSVMRASAMISLIVLGKLLLRHTNIFNVIAASAIILLAVNPFMIMEVGFQLSYLAVTGIVALQPWIYRLIYVPNKIFDWFWQLTSVSIAAQLIT
ncbi:MAG: ComEC family competence protein, partial [Bacteroidia bacterium]|nr:ComEC family competence protein [Bacteroidia bacterium]